MRRDLRDLHWVYVPWAGFLFALGGWSVKALRRWLLPLTGGLLARRYGLPWWRCVSYTVLTVLVFSLGYSPDSTPWWQLALVGASYGATPLVLMRWSWWHVVAPLGSLIAFLILLNLTLAFNWFPHKIFEIGVGSLHGLWVALALQEWQQEPAIPDA